MIDFRAFESLGSKKPTETDPVYLREPQGLLRKSPGVRTWDKIGIGKSSVARKGVYCMEFIKNGEKIEEAPYIQVPKSATAGNELIDYVFKINDEMYAVAFGYASMYNHRNQPSAKWVIDEDKQIIVFTALRDIQPGEEIFISYGKGYWATRDITMKTSPTLKNK